MTCFRCCSHSATTLGQQPARCAPGSDDRRTVDVSGVWSRVALQVLVCLLCWSGFLHSAAAEDSPELRSRVEKAVRVYAEAMECRERGERLRRFSRAEQMFRQIIDGNEPSAGIRNADLFVNLGNAALQAEHLGNAIVAYRKALRLAPQHAQARQNLAHARSLLPNWVQLDPTPSLIDSLFFWRLQLTSGQLHLFGGICFLAGAISLAVGIARKQPLWRNLALLPFLVWGVLLASEFVELDATGQHDVVVVQETPVYSADSKNSPRRLSKLLPSGAELKLIQRRERWSELALPDGRSGWVPSSAVEQVGESS